jgi:hypothetical protein
VIDSHKDPAKPACGLAALNRNLNQFFSSVFTDEDLNRIPAIEECRVGWKETDFEKKNEEEILNRLVALYL